MKTISNEDFTNGKFSDEDLEKIASGEIKVKPPAPDYSVTGPTIALETFEAGRVTPEQPEDITDGRLRLVDRPEHTVRSLLARGQKRN